MITHRVDAASRDPYEGMPLDAHLLELDREALETAYKERLVKLFDNYLTHGTSNAAYFINGLRIARRGYNNAAAAIKRREQQQR